MRPPTIPVRDAQLFAGAPFDAHELRTSDGVTLAARQWPARDDADMTVVIAHGFTGTQDQPGLRAVAADIWSTGAGVVTFDARGHGQSSGSCTMGELEPLDVQAAVTSARSMSRRVAVVGVSMGALAALRFAAATADLEALVLVSCPATWRLRSPQAALAAAATRTGLGRRLLARFQRVRIARGWRIGEPPVQTASNVTCATAVVHGLRDRFIPVSEARRLHASLAQPARLDLVPGMGHAFQPQLAGPLIDALSWTVAAPGD